MDENVGIITFEKMDNRRQNSVGSSRIRMRWMLPFWEEAEEFIIGKKYETIIFQKVYWRDMMESFTGVKILDLCDPDWLSKHPVFEFVDLVDAVVTSTEELATFVRKIRPGKLVKCIPDRIYLPEAEPIKTEHSDTLKKVVWFGYTHNSYYLQRTFEVLIEQGIELTVIAESPIEAPIGYKNRININNIVYNYQTINKELIKHDAVLMPTPYGDERSKYKSNNKTLQSWSLGLPVISSPEHFEQFASKEAREQEAKLRLQEVKDKWDVAISAQEYKDLIAEIKQNKGI
jgi:hypothetical protein